MSDTQLDRIEKSIYRIEGALFIGNGKPPVLSRLATLEEWKKNTNRMVAVLIGLAIGFIAPK